MDTPAGVVANDASGFAAVPRPSAIVALTTTPFDPLAVEMRPVVAPALTPVVPPAYDRRGRLRVAAETQVFGNVSGHYVRDFRRSRLYTTDLGGQSPSRTFVRPNGETVPVRFQNSDSGVDNYRRTLRLDAGILRQFSSGFAARAKLGLYYATNERLGGSDAVSGTTVREDFYARRFMVPFEVSLQYTLRKRKRFRPYVGVGLGTVLAYDGVERLTFKESGAAPALISELRVRGIERITADIVLEAGFQYRINDRWSAGLATYANGQSNYFIENPYGLEVRYSLR